MADFDAALPVRTTTTDQLQVQTASGTKLAVKSNTTTDLQTQVGDSTGTLINPAKEDGHLATIDTSTASNATNTSAISAKLPATIGQKASAASLAVVIASDQGTIPVSISGDQGVNIDKVGNTAVTLGAKVSASSIPVVLASDQAAIPVSISGDQGVNIDKVGNTTITLGSKVSTSSFPVVIASDQGTVPVSVVASATQETLTYNTASAVASNAQSIHSYTPGSTISLDGIECAASGEAKWELQWGATGSETTKFVSFTSKATQRTSLRLPYPVSIPSTSTIKIIRTNMDNQAMDVYSTILSH